MAGRPPPHDASSQSRNEYIPSFITKKPFFLDDTSEADYLKHQRLQAENKDTLDKAKWYDRGRKSGPAATKFRKGACENCGAMTHKTKECLSRPRKQGAKWTGRDIQADEMVEDVQLGWDAKRDRWNGYDAREYTSVVKEYEELEALKRAASGSANIQKASENGESPAADSDARYGEETDMGRSQPTSTRQLRLREDTAKYLLNLDLDSARYDPKTRSMDTSQQALTNDPSSAAEDGFVRPAGTEDDAAAFERAQKYAWETQESTTLTPQQRLHLQANPTEGALLMKKQQSDTSSRKIAQREALLAKYGDQATHQPSSFQKKQNQITANERYVEYDESGHIKGQPHKVARSKYAEDVLSNNHTSVWGSWWRNFTWGYACCHSTTKNSYCTGEAGRIAFEAAEGLRAGENLLSLPPPSVPGDDEQRHNPRDKVERVQSQKVEVEEVDAPDSAIESALWTDGPVAKKRTLQEIQSGITEEEMENYKRNRRAADDPMASLLGKDELLR